MVEHFEIVQAQQRTALPRETAADEDKIGGGAQAGDRQQENC
jgi:hypothetical protein